MAVAALRRHWTDQTSAPRASRVNVGPIERWLSALAGGALMTYGLRRRKAGGTTAMVTGANLLYRGVSGHCQLYSALGINRSVATPPAGHGTGMYAGVGSDTRAQLGGAAGIHVDEAITVNRPVSELFRFWRNLENLPTFMKHLDAVAEREAGVSHWVAVGPGGMKVEWDARIIMEVDNKLIGWQSLDGSTVSTAGSVNFREAFWGGTEIRVRLQYNPPGGKLGAAIAWLFGEEPSTQIHEDLRRFKQLMETGEITGH